MITGFSKVTVHTLPLLMPTSRSAGRECIPILAALIKFVVVSMIAAVAIGEARHVSNAAQHAAQCVAAKQSSTVPPDPADIQKN